MVELVKSPSYRNEGLSALTTCSSCLCDDVNGAGNVRQDDRNRACRGLPHLVHLAARRGLVGVIVSKI